ncbi:hypothetical protein [Sphingobacterium thalpophilum]|uniref:hypothetical protein n=1 Tax=Sphingobacterium thalpophilum TaxID=259 RepID=UPI003D99B9A9
MKKMKTPESRQEFEHNLNLLVEEGLSMDRAPDEILKSFLIFTFPSLKKVKYLPNGRINFNTVDEDLRLNANSKNHLRNIAPFWEESEN